MSLPEAASNQSAATVQQAIEREQQLQRPQTEPSSSTSNGDTATDSDEDDNDSDNAQQKTNHNNVTVFQSQTDFTVKHPLYSPWTLWFDSASKQDKAKSWDEALVKVISFSSVEEFWSLYNNIVPPSLIHPNSNYYLFKQGVKPAWEDNANSKGGKWSVQLPRGKYSDQIDNFWLYTMLAAIGETLETPYVAPSSTSAPPTETTTTTSSSSSFSNEITGVIVSSRKAFYRINIWTRTSSNQNKSKIENIGKHFKYGVLGFEENFKISERDKVSSDVEFVSHKDSQAKYGTKVQKWTI
ncbi:eukaryotic translation initiation factor 4E [Microbotryomycetes sp. JL221]|nr:eukaryotic translation initiation factor 4E [Microbotryomycetes sp. JL221]